MKLTDAQKMKVEIPAALYKRLEVVSKITGLDPETIVTQSLDYWLRLRAPKS